MHAVDGVRRTPAVFSVLPATRASTSTRRTSACASPPRAKAGRTSSAPCSSLKSRSPTPPACAWSRASARSPTPAGPPYVLPVLSSPKHRADAHPLPPPPPPYPPVLRHLSSARRRRDPVQRVPARVPRLVCLGPGVQVRLPAPARACLSPPSLLARAALLRTATPRAQIRNRKDPTVTVKFGQWVGAMVPAVRCRDHHHEPSKQTMFGICETNELGEVRAAACVARCMRAAGRR